MDRNLIELNTANFEQVVLRASNLVLVQFWATWSEPSKAMMPVLESVTQNVDMPVRLARVNVDDNQELAETYGVQGLPTLLIFNRGTLQDQVVGRTTEWELHQRLEGYK